MSGRGCPSRCSRDLAPGPADKAELADSLSLSLALLVVLERLNPVERAAYLLREVFGYEYAEIAGIIERTWGFDWQMPLPGGGDAVGWEVELDIDLLFVREATRSSRSR